MGKKSLVLRLRDLPREPVEALLARFGMRLEAVAGTDDIPGSFWGDEEAGLAGNRLYARDDTPLHSVLHEACHWICMDSARREGLDTDAGGGYDEENAVCYLQIVLAGLLPGFGGDRCMEDMDAWGYSFRLGSARAWFEQDADDALAWLRDNGILNGNEEPTWEVRL